MAVSYGKIYAEYPSSSPEYKGLISQNFKNNDWVIVNVSALSYGIISDPDFEVKALSEEFEFKIDLQYELSQLEIEKSYQKAKDSLFQLRYEVPELPQSYYDDFEKRGLEFLETVDKRCCLPWDEYMIWMENEIEMLRSIADSSDPSDTSASSPVSDLISNGATAEEKGKNSAVELILCLLLGTFGAH